MLRKRIELDVAEELAHRSQVPARPHAREAPRRSAGALENYREILFSIRATTARAGARGAARQRGPARRGGRHPRRDLRGARRLGEAHPRARDPRRGRGRRRPARRAAAQGGAHRGRRAWATSTARSTRRPGAQGRSRRTPNARRARGARRRSDAWDKLDAIFGEIAEGLTDAALAREYWMRLAHIHERLGKVDEAAKGYEHVLSHRIRPTPRRSQAMDALYRRTERWGDLIGVFRRRIELASDGADARSALRADGRGLRGEARQARGRDRRVPRGAGARRDEPGRARRARRLFTRQQHVGRARREPRGAAAPRRRRRGAARAHAPPRRAARVGDEPGRRRRSKATARCSSASPPTRRRSPRSSGSAERATHELAIAEILEPLYRQVGDYQKLIGVHEVQVAQRRRCRAQGRAAAPDRARCTRTPPAISTPRSTRCARALREDPVDRADAAGPRSPRARHRVASPISRRSSKTLAARAAGSASSRARSTR